MQAQTELPFISVIVPVHNSRAYLSRSLASLCQSDYPRFELIAVDDGSNDGSREIARQYADTLVALEKSQGPAKARNIGARKSRGEILFFVDADVKVAGDTVSRIARAMLDDRGTAALFGSYDTNPPAVDFFSQYKNLFHHFIHQNAGTMAGTFWAGCGAIRKDIFMETGGFPERYDYPTIEDVELGYTITSKGEKIKLLKDIQVTHLKIWNFFSLIKTDILQRAIPWTRLAFKKGGVPYNLNFKLADRISGAASIFLFITFILMWRWKGLAFGFIILAGALLCLNAALYRFFYRKRGTVFTAGAILFHWLYLFYSSVIFICLSTVLFLKNLFVKR